MNRLEIQYQPITDQNNDRYGMSYFYVDVLIDGCSFLEMVKEFESRFDTQQPGQYSINIYSYSEDFLLGRCPNYEEEGKYELLACSCGDSGCGSLTARIRVEENCVLWDLFESPRNTDWDYSGFEPFIFDLDEYKLEIQKIPFIKKLVKQAALSYWDL